MALSRQARAGNCSDQQSVVRIGKAQFGRLTFRIESSSRAAVTGIIVVAAVARFWGDVELRTRSPMPEEINPLPKFGDS